MECRSLVPKPAARSQVVGSRYPHEYRQLCCPNLIITHISNESEITPIANIENGTNTTAYDDG